MNVNLNPNLKSESEFPDGWGLGKIPICVGIGILLGTTKKLDLQHNFSKFNTHRKILYLRLPSRVLKV